MNPRHKLVYFMRVVRHNDTRSSQPYVPLSTLRADTGFEELEEVQGSTYRLRAMLRDECIQELRLGNIDYD